MCADRGFSQTLKHLCEGALLTRLLRPHLYCLTVRLFVASHPYQSHHSKVACGGAALERSADGRTLSVVAVEAYSPCAVAGVKAGDVLILANGERLASFVSSGGKKKGKKQTSFKDDPASSSTAAESIDLPRPVLMSSPSFSMAAPLVSELAKTLSIIKKPYKLTLVRRVHGEKTGISNSFASQAAVATAAAAQGPTTEGGAGGGGSGDSWAKPGGGFKAALKRASAAHKAAKGFGGATNDDLAAGFVDYSKQQRRNSASASNSMDNAATRVVVVFPEKVETWSSLKLEVRMFHCVIVSPLAQFTARFAILWLARIPFELPVVLTSFVFHTLHAILFFLMDMPPV